jgi:tRNA(fMet)-specific endonuclease VapC
MVVLDTDHVSLLERADSPERARLLERLRPLTDDEKAATIISYEEQTRGWLNYLKRARTVAEEVEAYRRLNEHLETYRIIRVLQFDEHAATEFQRLRRAGFRVGTMDLKIAAIVLANNATLLSRNLKDFRKISGLRVEDWTQEPGP